MNERIKLSQAQQRVMNTETIFPGTAVNVIAGLVFFEREYEPELFERALGLLERCSAALRIRLERDGESWRQYDGGACDSPEKAMFFPERFGSNGLDNWAARQTREPFELQGGRLCSLVPVMLKSGKVNALYMKFHHVAGDGWSFHLLVGRVAAVYTALEENCSEDAVVEKFSDEGNYTAYLDDERSYLNSPEYNQARGWWLEQFNTALENKPLLLHTAASISIDARRSLQLISPELAAQLDTARRTLRCTLFQLITAAFSVYCARATDSNEAVLASVHHGRLTAAERNTSGMFVNTFLLQGGYDAKQPFASLVDGQKQQLHEIFHDKQRYPYNHLFDDLLKAGIAGSSFAPLNIVQIPPPRGAWRCEFLHNGCEASPLTMYIDPNGRMGDGRLEIAWDYQTALFDKAEIARMQARFAKLLEGIADNPQCACGRLPIMAEDEYQLVRHGFNDTFAGYPADASLISLWDAAVRVCPDKAAIVYNSAFLTFSETDRFARLLAGQLNAMGVGRDNLVGILCERSLEMIPLAIAIMRAGAAYLPVDPHYPDDRIEYMLADSQAQVLFTQRSLDEKVANYSGTVIYCEGIIREMLNEGAARLTERCRNLPEGYAVTGASNTVPCPEDMCYMIYTSGSTGKPKGVMIEHRNLANICLWHHDYHSISAADNTAFYSGFGFDASVWEIFPFLTAGVTVHVIADDIRMSPLAVNEYFNDNNITVANLPTQFCEQFMELCDNRSLRRLVTGGDKLNSFKKMPYALINEYGPTEYTISATAYEVREFSANIPIGKPLANTELYVVDSEMQLVPVGVPGELCISGRQLARGYWQRPDLTAEKFVGNPFSASGAENFKSQISNSAKTHHTSDLVSATSAENFKFQISNFTKMYRTGDRVRWLPDGNIEFMGRIDFQVKIRGFRIELGEIEQALYALPEINSAAVLAVNDGSGEKVLCAFVVTENGAAVDHIKQSLGAGLPDYMVPEHYVFLDDMPLTANGKVDRRALPAPQFNANEKNLYEEPQSSEEQLMAAVWQNVLNIPRAGLNDNFFMLGGNSLRAGILQARLQKEHGVRISLPDIFRYPTLREMAELLCNAGQVVYERILPGGSVSECPLSETQSSMFAMLQLGDVGTAYNISIAYQLDGALDCARLERAINEMIDRHDILRSVFSDGDGYPEQRILPRGSVRFTLEYLPPVNDVSMADELAARFVRPHDLSVAPLFRIGVSKIPGGSWIMLVDFNHIIMDGSSMALFWEELGEIYDGKNLPQPSLQYSDYVRWQQGNAAEIARQEKYWLAKFDAEPEPLALPYDFPRPDAQNFEGNREFFSIDAALHSQLRDAASSHGVSLYMFLLTALKCMLYRYSGQEDLVVGSVCAGRSHSDLERIIGMFVNTLALRTSPGAEKSFSDYLAEVAAAVMEGNDNQDYPFHKLAQKAVKTRDNSRNPLFDVMFVLQNTDSADPVLPGISVNMLNLNSAWSQVDITLEMEAREDGTLAGLVEYSSKLFRLSSIQRMISHFINILKDVCIAPQRRLADIVMLGAAERHKLLNEYNSTDIPVFPEQNVCERFRNIAAGYAENTALVFQNRRLSYRQLDKYTDYLAALLQEYGCRIEDVVAVICGRSERAVLAELAILKAGAAFLPVDPQYPQERIEYMLTDSAAKIVFCERQYAEKIPAAGAQVIWLDEIDYTETNSGAVAADTKELSVQRANLCYVIYTSGSTGKPKGVMLEHGNLLNLCAWAVNYHGITDEDSTAAYSGFGFDASVWEIYPWLLAGATVHIIPENMKLLLPELDAYFSKNDITVVNLPTQICEQYIEQFPESGLRTLVTGGDKLRVYEQRPYRLVNEYGPTEFTVSATAFSVDRKYDNIPIGRPLGNCHAYIIDRNGNLAADGVPGELCLAGPQLARGYLNRPELTAEKFVDNPFSAQGAENFKFQISNSSKTQHTSDLVSATSADNFKFQISNFTKMYRTGDLVRWNEEGNLEYLGRVDMQVKIRGFRIELGEIEQQLLKHPAIKDAAVFALEGNGGGKYLCAWYVPSQTVTADALKKDLAVELPEYMVPAAWVELAAIPLNANGKVDRRALPQPEFESSRQTAFEAPSGKIEEAIATVWNEILGCGAAGRNDSFLSLGGDSIKAIQVIARLKRHDISAEVKWLLKKPLLADFAATVKTGVRQSDSGPVSGDAPLTAIQRWFFRQNIRNRAHWNHSVLFSVTGEIDFAALDKALKLLAEHHDALRMVYRFDGNEVHQYNRAPGEGVSYVLRRSNCTVNDEDELMRVIQSGSNELQQSMNLEAGPLLQCCLFESGSGNYLAVVVHHLVMDDVSWQIIGEDLNAAYEAYRAGRIPQLPPRTDSFKRWAEAAVKYAASHAAAKDRMYWQATDSAVIDKLPVRTLQPQSDTVNDLRETNLKLTAELTAALTAANNAYGTSPDELLLAAFARALGRWSNGAITSSAVTLESHGRQDIGLGIDNSRTIGWYTAAFPLLLDCAAMDTGVLVKTVKERLRSTPSHGISYDVLHELAPAGISLEQRLATQIEFIYHGDVGGENGDDQIFTPYSIGAGEDIAGDSENDYLWYVSAAQANGIMSIDISANHYLFEQQELQKFAACYHQALQEVAEHCRGRVAERTPSDYGCPAMQLAELENIREKFGDNIEDIMPLSPMQQGMLFEIQLDNSAYIEQNYFIYRGALDRQRFEAHFAAIIARHGILRTVFSYAGGELPWQIVLRNVETAGCISWMEYNTAEGTPDEIIAAVSRAEREKCQAPERAPFVRLCFMHVTGDEYRVVYTTHHLITDGWSEGLFLQELFDGYYDETLLQPKGDIVPYRRFIDWIGNQDRAGALEFWSGYLEGIEERTEILPRAAATRPEAAEYCEQLLQFSAEDTAALKAAAAASQITLGNLLMAMWALLLMRYNNRGDVVFGYVDSGRRPEIEGVERMLGLTINTVPVRVQMAEGQTFSGFARDAAASFASLAAHNWLPLSDIQKTSVLKNALVSHLLVFQNLPGDENAVAEYSIEETGGYDRVGFDFGLAIVPGDTISINFSWNKALYSTGQIDMIGRNWIALAKSVAARPEQPVCAISLLSGDERAAVIEASCGEHMPVARDKTIVDMFAAATLKYPDKTALVGCDASYTFAELDDVSGRLAALLQSCGLKKEQPAAVLVNRNSKILVAALAVMRAGGVYLPVDPSYPDERIEYMLTDSAAAVILTESALKNRCDGFKGTVIVLDETELLAGSSEAAPQELPLPQQLAYIIYTSGSTGKPKGVMIEHRSLMNITCWIKDYYQLQDNDVMAAYSGFSFDASVWELFPFAAQGCTLHIIPENLRLSAAQLNEYFIAHGVTITDLPTQFCEHFMESVATTCLRSVTTGGDKLRTASSRGYRLVNEYGPTEFTISATAFVVDDEYANIPIGRPLANCAAYITDRWGNLQPDGVPGELCLSGIQLARGYLGRPELTAEKFVANPFVNEARGRRQEAGSEDAVCAGSSSFMPHTSCLLPHARMYRTGDLVRRTDGGNIEFLGRIDQQVKIRGFRIELGEIEQQLLNVAGLEDAAVIAVDDGSGGKILAAYYCGAAYSADELRAIIGKTLPEYMLPTVFTHLEKIPVTANGKVDKRALPLDFALERQEYAAPENDTENWLALLWSELLGIETVGVRENFFSLGGYSLKLAVMAGKIKEKFNVSVPLSEIYAKPVIRELAAYIGELQAVAEPVPEIVHVPDRKYYPLAAAQKRMYILDGMEGAGRAYHITSALVIEGELNRDRFGRALEQVVQRHEALRTSFELRDGEPVQIVHENVKYKRIIREAADDSSQAIARLVEEFVEDIRLASAPLFKMELVRFSQSKHLFLFDVHHIIFDGLSAGIFISELFDIYSGKKIAAPQYQYRDFVIWQQQLLESGKYRKMKEYWLEQFSGEIPVLSLPADFSRPPLRSFEGSNYEVELDAELTAGIGELCRSANVTPFMLYLAVYYVLLAKYSGQEDIVVGTPGAGRFDSRLDDVIGMFVSTLPLRAFPEGNTTFTEFLKAVAANSMRALDNQDYPLEDLIDSLGIRRDSSRNPLFDVMFSYDRVSVQDETGGLKISAWSGEEKASQFDLTLEVFDGQDTVTISFEYATRLFRADSIARMAGHYVQLLRTVCSNSDARLSEISMLDSGERNTVLNLFNATALTVPRDATAAELFAEQARKQPDKTALVYKDETYTFRRLYERCARLATLLTEAGAGPERVVAVMVNRSADIVIGGMAAQIAGAAFLPVDPGYPDERIQYMLQDSQADILLTHAALAAKAGDYSGTVFCLDDGSFEKQLDSQPLCTPQFQKPENLAYIIYTSGSTGKPKGVMLEQRNLLNLCAWVQHYHDIEPQDRAATYSGFGFDASIWEMYPFLLYGNTLYIIPDELRLSPQELGRYLDENKISIINLPTQFCEQFMELSANTSLKTLVTGGDKLRMFNRRGYRLVNEYGPTEYTVSATAFVVDKLYENIPIGKPLANSAAYITDKYGNLQPIGVPGELCLSGNQLARGYLNRPDLTAEKFVDNPFSAQGAENFKFQISNFTKMYRTGDLARWLPDGNIEFLGRIDSQVKIRGYRIETGEIEQQMLAVEGVDGAVVVDYADFSGNRYLAGYYAAPDNTVSEEQLRAALAKELPDYMVPSHLVRLAEIPLTANGKIDKRALPQPQIAERGGSEQPQTVAERDVAKVWQVVLGGDAPYLDDNFFDIGGNSIKAISVTAKLSAQYAITINDIFQHQTLRQLAKAIKPVANNLLAGLQKLKEELQNGMPVESGDTPEIAVKRARYLQLAGKALVAKNSAEYWDSVLLTGATGYLGSYLLRQLIEDTAVQIVTIVRGKDDNDAARRLAEKLVWYFGQKDADEMLQSGRVSVLCGNLEQPWLGLDEQVYRSLQGSVGAVIHTAANVRHFGKYEEFYASNVSAVENLLKFAGSAIELHHISTVSVAEGEIENCGSALFTEFDLDIGQSHENVYLETKLLAEKAIDAAREQGTKASIYRVGNISMNHSDGRGQQNIEENAFFAKMKAYVNLGAAPRDASAEELSYVDCLADAVLRIAGRRNLLGGNYHLFNPHTVDMAELLAAAGLDMNVRAMDMAQFVGHLIKHFDKPGFRIHIENILTHMDLLAEEGTAVEVAGEYTVAVLKSAGFEWPASNYSDLRVLVEQALAERLRFLEKVPVFKNSSGALLDIARASEMRLYENRRDVVWEGDTNDCFHFVMEGFASVSRRSVGGWSGTVGMLRGRDFFGLESVAGSDKAGYTVEAELGELLTLAVPAKRLRQVLLQHPELALAFIAQLQQRNEQFMRLLVNLS